MAFNPDIATFLCANKVRKMQQQQQKRKKERKIDSLTHPELSFEWSDI